MWRVQDKGVSNLRFVKNSFGGIEFNCIFVFTKHKHMTKSFSFFIESEVDSSYSTEVFFNDNIEVKDASKILESLIDNSNIMLFPSLDGDITIDEDGNMTVEYTGYYEDESGDDSKPVEDSFEMSVSEVMSLV